MSDNPTTARPKFVYFDLPGEPRPVIDRNADQRVPEGLEQRRQKPVHALEGRQAQEHVAAERLQPAGGVRTIVVQQLLPQPVREFCRETPRPAIAPRRADPGDQRRRLAGCPGQFEQARDFGRVVLAVAVHRHDPWRARRADPGDQRRRLAAAPIVAQHADRAVRARSARSRSGGRVVAAVIDIDQLEIARAARAACRISAVTGATFSASLKTATTIEKRGPPASPAAAAVVPDEDAEICTRDGHDPQEATGLLVRRRLLVTVALVRG